MSKPFPSRRIVLLVLVLALAGGGYLWWRSQNSAADRPFVLQGNVEVRNVNLGFKVAGRIERMNFDEGDRVVAGQAMASLDKSYFENALTQIRAQRDQAAANLAKFEAGNRPQEIAQARAAVAEQEAALRNADVALARAEQLLKSATGTRKAYDDALAAQQEATARLNSARQSLLLMEAGFRKEDIDAARAQLADRDAAVLIAERQLADATLVAPNAGVILTRVHEVGAIVNAGEAVFVLSLTTPVWVRSYIAEPDLGRIKPGMTVEVTTDTPGMKPFRGTIGFISTTAEFTPKTVETRELRTALVYRLRIVVDDPDGRLRQGMPVTISLVGGAKAAVAPSPSR